MMIIVLSEIFDFDMGSPFIVDNITFIIQYWLVLMSLLGGLAILIYGVITKKVMSGRQVVVMVLSGVGVMFAFTVNSWVR
ncbi:MAG: hypothetical protein J4G04_06535 [Nitrosopumilaceae archaeon]|nr:hypothetical protein [Nitrosopumilaceae archaeon]